VNVCFVSEYFPPFAPGGAEWSLATLADALVARGHRVTIVTPNWGAAPREERDAWPVTESALRKEWGAEYFRKMDLAGRAGEVLFPNVRERERVIAFLDDPARGRLGDQADMIKLAVAFMEQRAARRR